MKNAQNRSRSLTSSILTLTALVLPGVLSCAFVVAQCAPSAAAKSPDWELVPPPPPTPVLEIPPPPVMVPYSYALQGGPELPEATTTFTAPAMPSIVRPKPPQPQPKPRPTGVRPINAPNLNSAYAAHCGFGQPRFGYDSKTTASAGAVEAYPSIPSAAPLNPWFDASLRWYANHLNEQQFYNNLAAKQNPYGAPDLQLATAYTSTYNANKAPQPVAQPTHHSSGRHHHHFGRKLFVSR